MTARGNILVADDDAAIRTVLNQALSRVGHEVRVTSNASTLWRWVAAGEGDLVITDVVMPDENAFDMLPRIKKARPELPVIVMSAQNTFMTAIRASETGAYEYLPKPFDLTELLNIVNRALSEPVRQARKHLGWYLDRHACAVADDSRKAILTTFEPASVTALLRDVLSRDPQSLNLRSAA